MNNLLQEEGTGENLIKLINIYTYIYIKTLYKNRQRIVSQANSIIRKHKITQIEGDKCKLQAQLLSKR